VILDTVVVGAGHAGLSVAALLTKAARSLVVLERGRIAETWRSQRWDSFQVNTPNRMNTLPEDSSADAPRDGFYGRDELVEMLERYARRLALPVRTGVTVTSLERAATGGGFVVRAQTGTGDVQSWESRTVVVASGIQRSPKLPSFNRELPHGVVELHSAQYRNPIVLRAGAVVVVGSGQSGCQIAEDLLAAGRTVYLCASKVGRLPRRYRGRDVLEWWSETGVLEQTVADLADPSTRFAPQPQVSGVGRFGHTVSLQQLARAGVHLLGRALGVNEGRLELDSRLGEYVRFGDEKSATFKRDVDEYIQRAGVVAPPPEEDRADAPAPELWSATGPSSLHLREAGVGTVIWCTGFTGDFGWIRLPVLDDRGLPVHQNGVSAVPGLYFLGFPWLTKRKSGIIYGIAEDAGRIAEDVARRLAA
jgi:putative flavoprotein involved in K+ transport